MSEEKVEKMKGANIILLAVSLAYVFDYMISIATGAYLTLPLLQRDLGITSEMIKGIMGIQSAIFLIGLTIGTFIAGWFADKYGRGKVFLALFYLEGISAIIIAFVQSVAGLYISRFIMGFFTGGVWPIAIAYIAEIWGTKTRGRAQGLGSFGIGIGEVGTYLVLLPLALLIGWQGGFLALAIITIACAIIFHRWIRETVAWKETKEMIKDGKFEKAEIAKKFTYSQLFYPDVRKYTMLATLGDITKNMLSWTVLLWIPVFLASKGFQVKKIIWLATAFSLAAVIGVILWSSLSDRFGRRPMLKGTSVLGIVSLLMLAIIPPVVMGISWQAGKVVFWSGYMLFGFTAAGMSGVWGAYMSELYPTRIRATGTSFSHGVGRAMSAIVVGSIGFGLLSFPETKLAKVFLVVGGILLVNMYFVAHFGPETAGKKLDLFVK